LQSGSAIPNARSILSLLPVVFNGLTAGSGYSAVVIGRSAAQPVGAPDSSLAISMMGVAKAKRVVYPAAEIGYTPALLARSRPDAASSAVACASMRAHVGEPT